MGSIDKKINKNRSDTSKQETCNERLDSDNCNPLDKSKAELASVTIKDIKKYQVTDIDKDEGLLHNSIENLNDLTEKIDDTQFYMESFTTEKKCLSSMNVSKASKDDLTDSDSPLQENNTNSTEYCSLFTPDVRRYASRLHVDSTTLPSKLSFNESPNDTQNITSKDNVRLSKSLTPKSYKPLDIKSPSICHIESLSEAKSRSNSAKKSEYSFEIKNSSLPNTPIARSTKIRKNAWLRGEENICTQNNKTIEIEDRIFRNSSNLDMTKSLDALTENFSNADYENVDFKSKRSLFSKEEQSPKASPSNMRIQKRTKRSARNNTICGALDSGAISEIDSFTGLRRVSVPRLDNDGMVQNVTNLDRFRSRSQSWCSRPEARVRVAGVDIKPLVAQHEQWIQQAATEPLKSVPTLHSYKGPLNAVKPASHRVDSALPNGPALHQAFLPAVKKVTQATSMPHDAISTNEIPPSVRLAVTRKRIMNAKPADFFENSLWIREKNKCTKNEDPQGTSTPYRPKDIAKSSLSEATVVNQATNTLTYQELCDKILEKTKNAYNTTTIPTTVKSTISNNKRDSKTPEQLNAEINLVKSSVLSELSENILKNKVDKTAILNVLEETLSSHRKSSETTRLDETITIKHNGESNEGICETDSFSCVDFRIGEKVQAATKKSMENDEEESLSLPDNLPNGNNPQVDDIIHKALKRCQAFSALQEARSTEDMYIDDELSAHMDMQALSDNMQLVPLHGNLHLALCSKQDCCLRKIQQEAGCERVFIICDHSNINKDHKVTGGSSSPSSADEDDSSRDKINSIYQNLGKENIHTRDLIDLNSITKSLSVIEEKSDDEYESDNKTTDAGDIDSMINFQDLISLYENEHMAKMETSAKEISIFILDDGEGNESGDVCQPNTTVLSDNIDDIIHV